MKFSRHHFLLAPLLVIANSVQAAWSLEPSYDLRAERSDNIHLATGNELAVTGGAFSPRLAVIMEEETQMFTGDIDLSFTRYRDHEELDREEGELGLDWRSATELSVFSINAGYSSQSSLDPGLDVSGVTDQQVDVRTSTINPGWRYQFAERWSLLTELAYSDVEYDQPLLGDYNNSDVVKFINRSSESVSFTLDYRFTEQDSLDITASFIRSNKNLDNNELLERGLLCDDVFECLNETGMFVNAISIASELEEESDSRVLQLGYGHQFDEIHMLNLKIGKVESETEQRERQHYFDVAGDELTSAAPWNITESDQSTSLYDLGYKYHDEVSNLEFTLSRSRVESSTGGQDEIDATKLNYNYRITERFSWKLNISKNYVKPDESINTTAAAEYTRTNAEPSVYYKLGRDWSLSLGYRYSELDTEYAAQPAKANAVFFTMSWREPQLLSTN